MTLLIVYGTLAIGVSFLCSLLEAGLLSLSASRIEAMVEQGSRVGRMLQHMKNNIDRPLAAILTLNTIAHTVGAAGVGAQAAVLFGDAAVGVASAIMTLAILVLSEIVPKTLGAVHARALAPVIAITTRIMIIVCLPLIIMLEWVNRAIGYQRHNDRMTRSEIMASVRLGHESGSLGEREHRIVSNVLALTNVRLARVLTPRTVVYSLPQEMTLGEVVDKHVPIRFARVPLYEQSPDHCETYVPRFDIDKAIAENRRDVRLADLARPLLAVPELASVADALERMLAQHEHIARVVDEYGGMEGIVTLEDLLETLLGQEIVDETDPVVDMQHLAKRRALGLPSTT